MKRSELEKIFLEIVDQLDKSLVGDFSFGWGDKSIGAVIEVSATGEKTWLKLNVNDHKKLNERLWAGEILASDISGVLKPHVITHFDFDRYGCKFRCIEMTFVDDPVISSNCTYPLQHCIPSGDWFRSLDNSLKALGSVQTTRIGYSQDLVQRRVQELLGTNQQCYFDRWVTSHCDLHWGNLTQHQCILLDWEGWGIAPSGTDQAFLLCYSVNNHALKKTIKSRYSEELSSRTGTTATLFACAELLRMIDLYGDHPELGPGLRQLVEDVLRTNFNTAH